MATGKSTVGPALASRLSFQVIDTDDLIEEKAGKSISEIFARDGEKVFRELESEIALEVSRRRGHVIITGGGIVLRERNLAALKKAGPVFCLSASPEEILRRTEGTSHRPLLKTDNPLARIKDLLKVREPFYSRADYTIETTGMSVREVVDCILGILHTNHPALFGPS
ncbi:MAG: shikimate kinase [Deltaproteobacteria bacterium]|nr:shikimate kinase [Deltaproteobacteria bacterium]